MVTAYSCISAIRQGKFSLIPLSVLVILRLYSGNNLEYRNIILSKYFKKQK